MVMGLEVEIIGEIVGKVIEIDMKKVILEDPVTKEVKEPMKVEERLGGAHLAIVGHGHLGGLVVFQVC
ncbi:MAG: hypothetical protein JAY95_00685 [Candidatus Thiodiazotropha taylori]|nr:hypothetical protein [Candidatus Thiodiazotropha taylori]